MRWSYERESCELKKLRMQSKHLNLEPPCPAVYALMSPLERELDHLRAALHLRMHRRELEQERNNG